MKKSPHSEKVVDTIIQKMENRFGSMTVTIGNEHTFVAMDIKFKDDGMYDISMNDYVNECVDIFQDKEVSRVAPTPDKGNLFDKDDGALANKLSENNAEKFHHTAAKLLYTLKRAPIDFDLAVSFLYTIVTMPTKGDVVKLIRVLASLPRTMGINGQLELHEWTDASYVSNRDMRGHTGGVISVGR